MGVFEVFKSGSSKLWYFHLKTENNEIIAASEGYFNKNDVRHLYETYFPEWEWKERK